MQSLGGAFHCGFCGERNETSVDPGGFDAQEYVEDCQVCCRPNVLRVQLDRETGEVWIHAELESR